MYRILSRIRQGIGRLLLGVGVGAALFGVTPSQAQGGKVNRPGERRFVQGRAWVVLNPGMSEAQLAAAVAPLGCEIERKLLAGQYLLRVKPNAGANIATDAQTLAAADALKRSGLFRWAGVDGIAYPLDVPNDTRYSEQWHHPVMKMPAAWTLQKGAANVNIVIMDTGFDVNHPDLAPRITEARNFMPGQNTGDVSGTPDHGTHVAGIAAAATNNAVGVAGVNWQNSRLHLFKCGDPGFPFSVIVSALDYIRTNVHVNGTKTVVNCSFGGPDTSDDPDPNSPFSQAFLQTAAAGIVVCIAAGNSYDQGNPPISPANIASLHQNILCVASVGPSRLQAYYSSARKYTTIAAPGGDQSQRAQDGILSTVPVNSGSYDFYQGTSMASPALCGVVSLLLSAGADPFQVRSILQATADKSIDPNLTYPNNIYGAGLVDAGAAVQLAASGVQVTNPIGGQYVYGTVPVTLTPPQGGSITNASLTLDTDPTVIGTVTGPPYIINWDTLATDPQTGTRIYSNGAHTLNISVTTNANKTFNFSITVNVDNPIAMIDSPTGGGYLAKSVDVVGTTDGLRRPTWTLEWAPASAPSTFTPIVANVTSRILQGTLANWDLSSAPDGQVILRLRVRNPDGFEQDKTQTVTVDKTPPSVPGNVAGTSSNQSATITWSPSTDNFALSGYNVYRSTTAGSGYTKINTSLIAAGPTPSFQETGLTNKTTYFYKVTAVDAAGNESPQSPPASVTPNRNGIASGQISSTDGTFISGATVTVLNQDGTRALDGNSNPYPQAVSSGGGGYSFVSPPGLLPGTYDLKVEAEGYVPRLIKDVTVALGVDAVGRNATLQQVPDLGSGFRMVSLPYDFLGKTLKQILEDTGLSVDNLKYYDTVSGTYLSANHPSFPKPVPGVGYWINRSGRLGIKEPGVPADPAQPVSIPIRAGWNLLGNPFQLPFSWNLGSLIIQRADNGERAVLSAAVQKGWALDFAWSGSDAKTLVYDTLVIPGVTGSIDALGAFWFYSNVAGTLTIAPPAQINRTARTGTGRGEWIAQIDARTGASSSSVVFGVAEQRRLFPSAPQVDGAVQIRFGADTRAGGGFGVDLKPLSGLTQTWDITLTAPEDKPVVLTWPSAVRVPRGFTASIVDTASGERVNLRTNSSYTVPSGRSVRTLKLELTRQTAQRLLISGVGVTTNRGSSPVLSYNISKGAVTTLQIIEAGGRVVRTFGGRAARSGQNQLVWDGRDNAGRAMPSGVYLLQVKAVADEGDSAQAVASFILTR